MGTTPIKALTTLEQGQASPEIVVNELIYHIDLHLNMVVVDKDLATPPLTPPAGATYFVASSPTGAWTSQAGKIATYRNSAWEFYTPPNGTTVYVTDESRVYVYQTNTLVALSTVIGAMQNISMLGVNSTADATNKFSVNSASVLFNNVGTNMQAYINKNADADTASVVFQRNFSGRAEFGLIGNNNFGLKTSPDGSSFVDAVVAQNSDGSVAFPQGQFNGLVTIADDAVAVINVPPAMKNSGLFSWHVHDATGVSPNIARGGLMAFDAGTTLATRSINVGTNGSVSTAVLTGTTGTDGNTTAAPNTSGQIQIENRTGASAVFRYLFIG